MELKGKYATAKIFSNHIEEGAKSQILQLLDQDFIEGAQVRIMPDVHQGMGCVIGFTADMGDKVIPNIVGVDIGCGIIVVELGDLEIDFSTLDKIIYNKIPSGFKIHNQKKYTFEPLQDLYCFRDLKNTKRFERSIGTLGGGNHFIEVAQDSKDNKYLIIHSGSRNLGQQVANHYQRLAINLYSEKKDAYKPNYPKDLCYLTGEDRKRYLHDMKICQDYASVNRRAMASIILHSLFKKDLKEYQHFETIHNYINFKDNIIRKGAISAHQGEKLLIPINMRDGSILAKGKGNPQWNYSAPHGAGRVMSRKVARESIALKELEEDMDGVYTTSINKSTLDEAPSAYKPMEEILENLEETVEIIDILKPLYNFKA